MDISCTFATSLSTPDHMALAERLGFSRAWCYDSPALYPDVWVTLARAAERTSVIGLGPAVLVPSLRHVMTNAAAIATLEAIAPGRVAYAVGSGFTGRLALGQKPMAWTRVRAYIIALKSLLAGEEVEWDGGVMKMLHVEGFAPARPLKIPVLVGASGPKGLAVAAEVADGIFLTAGMGSENNTRFRWVAQSMNGTVLDDAEPADSPRALAAAGHAAALIYHHAYGSGTLDRLPGGEKYGALLDALPERTRHLSLHDRHLIATNAIDGQVVTGEVVQRLNKALPAEEWRSRIAHMAQSGVTELVYQAAGPDIPRELQAFASMAGLTPRS